MTYITGQLTNIEIQCGAYVDSKRNKRSTIIFESEKIN